MLVFLVQPVSAKNELSKKEIRKMYSELFEVQAYPFKDRILFGTNTSKVPDDHMLSDFLKENGSNINYLLSHIIDKSGKLSTLTPYKDDPKKMHIHFIKIIKENPIFIQYFETLLFNYMTSIGKGIDDHLVDQENIPMDMVVDCMAKFIYINKIMPGNKYGGKFCVGINGIQETIKDRNFHIEAFCFNTLFNNFKTIIPIFQTTVNNIKKLKLGIKEEDRLLRAQGAMYLAISQNPGIRELLKNEYRKRKAYLPIRVPDWE